MKATTTRSIISIIHALFLAIIALLIIAVFSLLIWLKNGIYIHEREILGLKVNQLYIKWDKKITLTAQKIEKETQPSEGEGLSFSTLSLLGQALYNNLEEFHVKTLHIGDFNGSIRYKNYAFEIDSNILTLKTHLGFDQTAFEGDNFVLHIHPLQAAVHGKFIQSPSGKSLAYHLNYTLAQDANGTVSGTYENKLLSIDITAKPLKSIRFLEKFFNIPPKVAPWIFENIHADTFLLEKLHTQFSIEHPEDFLKNLHVIAHGENFAYLFDAQLFPMQSTFATVTFQNHDLTILPTSPSYADHELEQAQVAITGLGLHPKLAVTLHTQKAIDAHVMSILRRYRVDLPFVQTQGESNTTFALVIDLPTGEAHWNASIETQDTAIALYEKNIAIEAAKITVKDTQVAIDRLNFHYDNAIKASAKGSVDFKKQKGAYTFDIETCVFDPVALTAPMHSTLRFTPKEIAFEQSASEWTFLTEHNFTVTPHRYSFDRNETWDIASLRLYQGDIFDASIQGSLNFNQSRFNLAFLLQKLHFTNQSGNLVQLLHPVKIANVKKNTPRFTNNRPLSLRIQDKNFTIREIAFEDGDIMQMKLSDIAYDDIFSTSVEGFYHKDEKIGQLTLADFTTHPDYALFDHEELHFVVDYRDKPRFYHEGYGLGYIKEQSNTHIFYADALQNIQPKIPFLEAHPIQNGKLKLITRDFVHFNLFATLQNFPITGYINPDANETLFVSGTLNPAAIEATINQQIKIKKTDTVHISLENTGFDLRPLLKTESNDSTQLPKIDIDAVKGYLLFGEKNKLLYDALSAQLGKKNIYANIVQGPGKGILFLEGDKIDLFGEKFSDTFIKNLLGFEGLKGGEYNFFIQGKGGNFQGGIKLSNATAIDFAVYNNLLAYINTIPALLTFKAPGFDADGFTIKEGDVLFEKKDAVIDLKTIKLYGKSSNIIGSGSVDTNANTINMTLRIFLAKEMGAVVSKIPIAGYLLLGDDGSLTTTLSITGSLDKPDISVELGKDIIMAPINIIKRTINLPSKLLNWITGGD